GRDVRARQMHGPTAAEGWPEMVQAHPEPLQRPPAVRPILRLQRAEEFAHRHLVGARDHRPALERGSLPDLQKPLGDALLRRPARLTDDPVTRPVLEPPHRPPLIDAPHRYPLPSSVDLRATATIVVIRAPIPPPLRSGGELRTARPHGPGLRAPPPRHPS